MLSTSILPTGYSMRSDRLDDAPALARLWGKPGVFETLGQMPNVSVEYVSSLLKARARRDCGWVIEDERGRVIANCLLMEANSSPRRSHSATMMVAVSPDHRKRGLGLALVQKVVEHARGWSGFMRLEFMVSTSNLAALALYERVGFEREGTLKGYVLTDGRLEDAVAMALMLR